MLDPMTIGLLSKGVGQVAKTGTGVFQALQARKMAKGLGARPQYETPESAQQALELSAMRTMGGMPGQEQAQGQIGAQAGRGYQEGTEISSSPAAAMAMAGNVTANAMQQTTQMAGQEAQYKSQAEQDYIAQLGQQAGYEEKEFDINKMQPFLDKADAIRRLKESAMHNITGGVQELGGTATQAAQYKKYGPGNKGGDPYEDQFA